MEDWNMQVDMEEIDATMRSLKHMTYVMQKKRGLLIFKVWI